MGCFSFLLCFAVLLLSLQSQATETQNEIDDIHIVYMGAATSANGDMRNEFLQLLRSLERRNNTVVQRYSKGFTGFAARLSEAEVQSIAQRPGVVSVFRDPILHIHTTRSWDFLEHLTDGRIPSAPSPSPGADTIIGFLDSGIWPESMSFNDKGIGPIPSRWKGKCMTGPGFSSSHCNRKLIGARYYADPENPNELVSPRDDVGHGTHVAATAAGTPVSGASYYGLAKGTARGGSPGSRIAMYKVCSPDRCKGSSVLKAFDDAIYDGVDVISISLGASSGDLPDFSTDPIAIGAFHAVEKGITVVCSAGNDGPDASSVVNIAPWILTVAATTTDRRFETDVVLSGNKVFKGGSIQYSNLKRSPVYPITCGCLAGHGSGGIDADAGNCEPGLLDFEKVEGKIIFCTNYDKGSTREKLQHILDLGGVGMVMVDDDQTNVSSTYGSSPIATVTLDDGNAIFDYILSNREKATILPTTTLDNYKPAPVVAYFSGRGPTIIDIRILKPDVAAPGVDILAAWPSQDPKNAAAPVFNIISGTSMSAPHVSAIAARVKSQHPTWSPAAIRSAIMTTAIQGDNMHGLITAEPGNPATPFELGAGEVTTSGPLAPGLIYETETIAYLQFLCFMGYNTAKLKLIAAVIPEHFSCPSNLNKDLISNINYPSISISGVEPMKSRKVTRMVTNVGEDESTYTAIIETDYALDVKVTPNELRFTKSVKNLSYEVSFTLTQLPEENHLFGSIAWTNKKYKVQTPFTVKSVV